MMSVRVEHSSRSYVSVLEFVEMSVNYNISWLMENSDLVVNPFLQPLGSKH